MTDTQAAADPLVRAVADLIDQRHLIAPRGGVVVGVSGGADSVALLAALASLAHLPDRRWRLVVAHLDHMIRRDSEKDAQFVRQLADFLDLPCEVQRLDVKAHARRLGQGLEQAGRLLRYRFLAEQARRHDCQTVAVAHHADDNVETILYRIVRGTHLRGLGGIPLSRPLESGGPMLVRPLLHCTRAQIEAFCRRVRLNWRTDRTNRDTRVRRNFIRHHLLPLLRRKLNPRADEALLRLAGAAQRAESYLSAQARELLEEARIELGPQRVVLDWSVLASAQPVIRAHALRAALEDAGLPLRDFTAEHLAQLNAMAASPAETSMTLPGDFQARCQAGQMVIERSAQPDVAPQAVTLLCPGHTPLDDGRWITINMEPYAPAHLEQAPSLPPGTELIDADQIRGALLARPRQAGDRFEPLGSPGSASVSDFLTNLKLPDDQRRQAVCILDDLGLVYLAPLRIDQRVRLSARTRRVLRVSLTQPPADEPAEGEQD